jgi:hypothetical protein
MHCRALRVSVTPAGNPQRQLFTSSIMKNMKAIWIFVAIIVTAAIGFGIHRALGMSSESFLYGCLGALIGGAGARLVR